MASFTQRSSFTNLDSGALPIVAAFGAATQHDDGSLDTGELYTNAFWHVDRIEHRYGAEPSSMFVLAPTDGWGGIAPLLAGLAAAKGPLQNAKIWRHATALADGSPLFNGCVVVVDENLDKDGATIEVLDPRYEMEGCIVVGSWWIEDTGGGGVVYRQAIPAWFNKDGLPNRTSGEAGGFTYAFCETNYGLLDGQPVPGPDQNSAGVATHWTPDSIAVYLQEVTDASAGKSLLASFPEYCILPDDVIFPKGVASALKTFTADASTPALGLAKATEVIIDATPLNHALQHVFSMAGPFALNLTYEVNGKSTICVARTRGGGGQPKSLTRASGNATGAFSNDGCVIGGGIKRDGRNLFAQAVVAGNTQYVERRVTGTDLGTIDEQSRSGVELITAFDLSQKTAIMQAYNDARDQGRNLTLPQILQQFDLAFAAYRFNPLVKFSDGTSEDGMPFCRTTNRIALPHLLTRYRVEADDKKGLAAYDLKTGFFPIPLEYADTATDAAYDSGTPQAPASGGDNGYESAAAGSQGDTGGAGAVGGSGGTGNFDPNSGPAPQGAGGAFGFGGGSGGLFQYNPTYLSGGGGAPFKFDTSFLSGGGGAGGAIGNIFASANGFFSHTDGPVFQYNPAYLAGGFTGQGPGTSPLSTDSPAYGSDAGGGANAGGGDS